MGNYHEHQLFKRQMGLIFVVLVFFTTVFFHMAPAGEIAYEFGERRDPFVPLIGPDGAFVHKAMEVGLDSGIVNAKSHLDLGEADPELLKLVDAYAKMDGSAERMRSTARGIGSSCLSLTW